MVTIDNETDVDDQSAFNQLMLSGYDHDSTCDRLTLYALDKTILRQLMKLLSNLNLGWK